MPVTGIDIKSRAPFAGGKLFGSTGSYEQIDGTVRYEVDPNHPANEAITDIKLAPTNSLGRVEFTADFRLAMPSDLSKSNRRLFLDILNRGKNSAYRNLNSAPDVAPDAPTEPGNGFLMEEGYSIAWCGWQHDVPEIPGIMGIRVPEALDANGPIQGKIVVTFQPNLAAKSQLLSDRNHRSYPTSDVYDYEAVMTVQEHEDAPEKIIPRDEWNFARVEEETVVPEESGEATAEVNPLAFNASSLPEGLRAEPSLQTFDSVDKLAKSYVNAVKKIGGDPANLVSVPQDGESWDNFYNQTGRPETPEGYQFGDDPDNELEFYDS